MAVRWGGQAPIRRRRPGGRERSDPTPPPPAGVSQNDRTPGHPPRWRAAFRPPGPPRTVALEHARTKAFEGAACSVSAHPTRGAVWLSKSSLLVP
jgi:hypothetical protein